MEQWSEALETLRTHLDELENAMHLGDVKRVEQIRKWLREAMSIEREAYKEALKELKGK